MLRYVRAEGETPYERGFSIGKTLAMQIRTILEYQEQHYRKKEGNSLRENWLPVAERFAPHIKRHAPNTWLEMQGVASGAEMNFEDVLILASIYEKKVGYETDHCTAFAAIGKATVDGSLVCGQTNDESLMEWAAGELDVVVHHLGEEMEVFIYTHPGIPAYMGMNESGLCILWNYIDNGERGEGVPTNVIIRETLYKRSLSEAIDYLEGIPRSIPNNFLLAHRDEGICNVEYFPESALKDRGLDLAVHANHILDPEKGRKDVKRVHREVETTFLRQEALEEICRNEWGRIDPERAKTFFADHSRGWRSVCVHPHVRPHTRALVNKTLAAMVFHPKSGTMEIAFGNACRTPFQKFVFEGK